MSRTPCGSRTRSTPPARSEPSRHPRASSSPTQSARRAGWLRQASSATWWSAGTPLVRAVIAFPLLGFSINTLSLFGLILAIGLVVDDAIVVVEAVEHHIEGGMTPRDATLRAMSEVSGPVVAIALILAAVFTPVAFM